MGVEWGRTLGRRLIILTPICSLVTLRFLAAGMDSYVAKPLKAEELICAMARVVPEERRLMHPEVPVGAVAS